MSESGEYKDPLLDRDTLNEIGLRASERARQRAFANGSPITTERNGAIVQVFADGQEVIIKPASNKPFPTIEEDLCL